MEHPATWLDLLPIPARFTHGLTHLYMAGVAVVLLLLFSIAARIGLRRRADRRIPEDRLSVVNAAELAIDALGNLCEDVIGHGGRKYLWLLGSVFLYIFFNNLLGLIPGFLPATENLNTNLGIAVVVFISYNAIGIKENGWGYVKHLMGPVWWLAWLIFPIEFISHLVRPASLSIRLFGNIFADHLVFGIFSDLVPLAVPSIFLGLGLFVAFLQAFVFTLLSMIYIALATAHDH